MMMNPLNVIFCGKFNIYEKTQHGCKYNNKNFNLYKPSPVPNKTILVGFFTSSRELLGDVLLLLTRVDRLG